MGRAIRLYTLEPQATAVMRTVLPPRDLAVWLRAVGPRIAAVLADQDTARVGPLFARYTGRGDSVEAEAGFPVAAPIAGQDAVVPSGLPGGAVAVATHHGRRDLLDTAYGRLDDWLGRASFEAAGPCWERYPAGPHTTPRSALWRTDIVVPYRRGAAYLPSLPAAGPVVTPVALPVASGAVCV